MPFTLAEAQGRGGEERGGGKGGAATKGARAKLFMGKGKVLVMPAVLLRLLTASAFTPQSVPIWIISYVVTQIGYKIPNMIVARQYSFMFVNKKITFVLQMIRFGSDTSISFYMLRLSVPSCRGRIRDN